MRSGIGVKGGVKVQRLAAQNFDTSGLFIPPGSQVEGARGTLQGRALFTHRRLQRYYNLKAHYLPISQNCVFHKPCNISEL